MDSRGSLSTRPPRTPFPVSSRGHSVFAGPGSRDGSGGRRCHSFRRSARRRLPRLRILVSSGLATTTSVDSGAPASATVRTARLSIYTVSPVTRITLPPSPFLAPKLAVSHCRSAGEDRGVTPPREPAGVVGSGELNRTATVHLTRLHSTPLHSTPRLPAQLHRGRTRGQVRVRTSSDPAARSEVQRHRRTPGHRYSGP